MFSSVGSGVLILLHVFVIAVLIPETSERVHFTETIDIKYTYNETQINEKFSAEIMLEEPFKCMNWAELKYSSTNDKVDSTNLIENVPRYNMNIQLPLIDSYNGSGVLIYFYDKNHNTLEQKRLITFHHSNSRGLDEKHECLEHCTIIFNIKKVFNNYCKYNSSFKYLCCESNESSLPPVQTALDSQTFIEKEIESEIQELVKIDIFPNERQLNFTPGTEYTFICDASHLPHNTNLHLIWENITGKKIKTLTSSNKTYIEYSFHFSEIYNNSRIYCQINESTKSKQITLFLKEFVLTSTERLEASSAVFNNILNKDDVMQSTESTELSKYDGQEKENPPKVLWYIVPIMGVLCLSAGVVLYFYFKRKKNNASRDTDVYTYTTQQQIMYAQLQLDSTKSYPIPPSNDGISYTTIVGVLKPSN